MTSVIKNKLLWLTVSLSIVFVILSYLNNTALYPQWPKSLYFLQPILYTVQVPAAFVGILVSGNAEAPNAIAAYVALFITYIAIFGSSMALIRLVYKRIIKH